MQTTTPSVSATAVGGRYGLLTGLVSIIISFGIYALELEQNSAVRFLTMAVLIAGIALAMRNFKDQNGGFMDYGQGLGVGVMVSAVVGLLSGGFIYLYTTVVDPSVITRMIDKTRVEMEAKGLSDTQTDQAMGWTTKFATAPFMSWFTVLFTVLIGLLISLLVAAFVKNPKPEFE